MHTPPISVAARDLVLRYRADTWRASLGVGKITVQIDLHRDAALVTVNWPGCGDTDTAATASFVADITRASAIAAAAEQLLTQREEMAQ